MFTVFVTRTVGRSVLQKDFEELEGARTFFERLLAEKPYEGVMVMLLKRERYGPNFLMDANVIPSTLKLNTERASLSGFKKPGGPDKP